MNKLLKINNVYGAKIGNLTVFTKQGALDAYKTFLEVCHKNFSMESSYVLSEAENDMVKIGFDYEELEEMEIEFLRS